MHGFPCIISYHPAKFGGHRPCRRRTFYFSFVTRPYDTRWLEGFVTFGWVPLIAISPHYAFPSYPSLLSCHVWWLQTFSLPRDLTWLCGQRVTQHYGWISFIISDYPAKFGDHRPCGTGETRDSFCHVTTLWHFVMCNHGWVPLIISQYMPSLVVIGLAEKDIFWL